MMKIGIVTATYNRPGQLAALHESLAIQATVAEWCHYVVDDGSTREYSRVFKEIRKLSGNLRTKVISNSGVLIARNHAIEMAINDGCTHLCFIDDDDILLPGSISKIAECIRSFQQNTWFIFASKKQDSPSVSWPYEIIEMSWFNDIVVKRLLGSDNLVVVSVNLVGDVRFSTRGRNQREWKFFLKLCSKNDRVLVLPNILLEKNYLADGLTAQTQRQRYKPEQILNSAERAFSYWLLRPTSPKLLVQAIKQIVTAPIKLIFHIIYRNPS